MRKTVTSAAVLGFALAFGANAFAETVTPGSLEQKGNSITRKIGDINLDIELLKKEMEYQQLSDQRKSTGGQALTTDLPLVVDIFQKPDAPIMARLIFPAGDTRVVTEKQSIGNGITVSSITLRGVMVKYNGKAEPLGFAVNALPAKAPSAPVGMPASLQGFGR